MEFSRFFLLVLVVSTGSAAFVGATTSTNTSTTTAPHSTITPVVHTVRPTTNAPSRTTVPAATTRMTTKVRTTATSPNTTATSPAGNSTANATTAATTVAPEPPASRFRVNNSDGEACMLLNFNATMKVKYGTRNHGLLEARIPIMNTTFFEGSCANNTPLRNFTLYYPNKNMPCAELFLFFNATSNATYYNRQGIYVRYIEPCFLPDAVKFNTIDGGHFKPSYEGTIGKSVRCESVKCLSLWFTVTLDDILIQPFAEKSADKGNFGEVENCTKIAPTTTQPKTTMNPHPPTKPSTSNGGKIAGIVIGVVAAVAIIIGVAVYVLRKRRYKQVAYGNFENETTRTI